VLKKPYKYPILGIFFDLKTKYISRLDKHFLNNYFMKNEKQIRRILFSLSLSLSLIFLIGSCNQIEPEPVISELSKELSPDLKSINEKDLIHLSAIFASVLDNPDVLHEFYGYSRLEGNEGELEFSLRRVFETENDLISRKKSSIVSVFKNQDKSSRTQSSSYDSDFFIDFINQNDLEVLAPYLARNFSLEEIDELTISWWTQEMEDEGYRKDPNWKGETPAFRIKLGENRSLDSILEGLENQTIKVFMVSDEYAMENPTIVFGAFGQGLYERSFEKKGINNENLSLTNVVPFNEGITCDEVLSTDVVRYHMPSFRILDNTKGWPSGNFITFWVAYGAYNLNASGVPSLGFNVNRLVHEKKINRGDFGWKTDFLAQPILTHWHDSNISIQLIIAYQRNNHVLTQTVTSVSVNPTTGVTTNSQQTVSQGDTMSFGSQTWYRCAEINGGHKIDNGLGLYGGNAIWQFTGRDGRAQFTLEPRLTRL
jgi:hypothetical protein